MNTSPFGRLWLVVSAVAAAPAAMAILIHHYGVNVPYWDEWIISHVVLRAYRGDFDLASLWAQTC